MSIGKAPVPNTIVIDLEYGGLQLARAFGKRFKGILNL